MNDPKELHQPAIRLLAFIQTFCQPHNQAFRVQKSVKRVQSLTKSEWSKDKKNCGNPLKHWATATF